ncbi:MAG: sulfite exporter TauE/SafE family protein [Pyrinomonadaceae bacterium]
MFLTGLNFALLDWWQLILLAVLFFVTSVVGVVTGSNSLITVPVMFQFGIDPRVAVATNMFGLTFLSVGGTLPFLGTGNISRRYVTPLLLVTLAGSIIGALLVLVVPAAALPMIVSIAMLGVSAYILLARNPGRELDPEPRSRTSEVAAYVATFVLGIYGGFYSGGYVTLLTAGLVGLLGLRFVEAVATTKVINVVSSLSATLIFMWRGLIDYKLGLILGVVMFFGAFVGARVALKLNEIWLRRIFVATVVVLALKIMIFDFLLKGSLH